MSNINKKLFNELFDQAIDEIKQLIKIKSFSQEGNDIFPYGKDVHNALEYMINLGKKLGFNTKLGDKKRYGYIEYGKGSEMIGILCHLDVVPPGDLTKWYNPPFEPIIKNGNLYGRGSIDDKGPAVINLFALKYLVDSKFIAKKRIRLIFGLTEETSWDSINFYLKNEEIPAISYTPDGYFPIVYAEKTIVNLLITEKKPKQDFTIIGGVAFNVTCDSATYSGPHSNELIKILKLRDYKYDEDKNNIKVLGKVAHGSKPQEGINAGIQLIMALSEINDQSKLIKWIKDNLQFDVHLSKIFKNLEDESGKLTINIGLVNFNKKENFIGCDIRIPVHFKKEEIISKLNDSINKYGLIIEEKSTKKSLFFDKKSPIIKKLLKVYQKVTKDNSKPMAIGGGTYARSMDNCVAFGAIFDSKTSTEHQYNESVAIADLKKGMEIYIRAIEALNK